MQALALCQSSQILGSASSRTSVLQCSFGGRTRCQPGLRVGRSSLGLIAAGASSPASSSSSSSSSPSFSSFEKTIKKWLLEPVGDGDCSHLDIAVPMPAAFELSTEAATVGRVADRADIVIPVGTVSGLHARLEKKGTVLLVTDLNSTNGTFVDNKQLRSGAVTPVQPGSSITFGDEHLAQFKFTIVEQVENSQQEE